MWAFRLYLRLDDANMTVWFRKRMNLRCNIHVWKRLTFQNHKIIRCQCTSHRQTHMAMSPPGIIYTELRKSISTRSYCRRRSVVSVIWRPILYYQKRTRTILKRACLFYFYVRTRYPELDKEIRTAIAGTGWKFCDRHPETNGDSLSLHVDFFLTYKLQASCSSHDKLDSKSQLTDQRV